MTGVMYKQFSVTIAVSVLISALVALTLTPSLCALIIKPDHGKKEPMLFFRWFNVFFEKVTDCYLAGVKYFLEHRKTAILSFLAVIVAIIGLFRIIPGGLVPNEDQGNLLMAYNMPPASSLPRTVDFTDKISEMVKQNPNVEDVLTINGFNMLSATQNTYSGISFITLKDWEKRQNADQSADALAGTFTGIGMSRPEGVGFSFGMPPIMGMSTTGGFEGYIQNRGGHSSAELMAKVEEFIAAAEKRPELQNVKT